MYSPRLCLSCFERLRKRESQGIRYVVSLSSGVQQIGFVVVVVLIVVFSFCLFFPAILVIWRGIPSGEEA